MQENESDSARSVVYLSPTYYPSPSDESCSSEGSDDECSMQKDSDEKSTNGDESDKKKKKERREEKAKPKISIPGGGLQLGG